MKYKYIGTEEQAIKMGFNLATGYYSKCFGNTWLHINFNSSREITSSDIKELIKIIPSGLVEVVE